MILNFKRCCLTPRQTKLSNHLGSTITNIPLFEIISMPKCLFYTIAVSAEQYMDIGLICLIVYFTDTAIQFVDHR